MIKVVASQINGKTRMILRSIVEKTGSLDGKKSNEIPINTI